MAVTCDFCGIAQKTPILVTRNAQLRIYGWVPDRPASGTPITHQNDLPIGDICAACKSQWLSPVIDEARSRISQIIEQKKGSK